VIKMTILTSETYEFESIISLSDMTTLSITTNVIFPKTGNEVTIRSYGKYKDKNYKYSLLVTKDFIESNIYKFTSLYSLFTTIIDKYVINAFINMLYRNGLIEENIMVIHNII
jgi:hypothetical protein